MSETSVITRARRIKLCAIASDTITHIAFGDGGVDSNGDPIMPLETQTSLNNEIARYPIDGVEYPVDTTARYTVEIPKNDLVGMKISEAAIVDKDGALCAIKTMYVKQKDDGVSFIFNFDDEF